MRAGKRPRLSFDRFDCKAGIFASAGNARSTEIISSLPAAIMRDDCDGAVDADSTHAY